MTYYKRTGIILLGMVFGIYYSGTAQQYLKYPKRTPEEKARYFTKKMVDSLEVTTAQEEALYLMNIELTKKFDSIRQAADSLSKQERSTAYRVIFNYRDSCMRHILPRKEFLKFLDNEREKWEQKKATQRKAKGKEP